MPRPDGKASVTVTWSSAAANFGVRASFGSTTSAAIQSVASSAWTATSSSTASVLPESVSFAGVRACHSLSVPSSFGGFFFEIVSARSGPAKAISVPVPSSRLPAPPSEASPPLAAASAPMDGPAASAFSGLFAPLSDALPPPHATSARTRPTPMLRTFVSSIRDCTSRGAASRRRRSRSRGRWRRPGRSARASRSRPRRGPPCRCPCPWPRRCCSRRSRRTA